MVPSKPCDTIYHNKSIYRSGDRKCGNVPAIDISPVTSEVHPQINPINIALVNCVNKFADSKQYPIIETLKINCFCIHFLSHGLAPFDFDFMSSCNNYKAAQNSPPLQGIILFLLSNNIYNTPHAGA